MTDSTGVTGYAYDFRDRLIEKATPFGTLFYSWDAASNLTEMQSSNVNGAWTTYTYDAANRLQTLTDRNLGLTTTYTRNGRDLPTRVRYGNTQLNDTIYDSRFRVTRQDLVGAAPRKLWDYTVDGTGRRLTATESNGPLVSYEYDDTYKLTREEIAGDPTDDGALVYSYDPTGNRLELFSTLAAVPPATYGFDLNDRLLADTYDANGNTVSSGGTAYVYDFEDRLVNYDSGEVTNVYDADGNRVLRTRGASGRSSDGLQFSAVRGSPAIAGRRSPAHPPCTTLLI